MSPPPFGVIGCNTLLLPFRRDEEGTAEPSLSAFGHNGEGLTLPYYIL